MDKVKPMKSAITSKELGNLPFTVDWYISSIVAKKLGISALWHKLKFPLGFSIWVNIDSFFSNDF